MKKSLILAAALALPMFAIPAVAEEKAAEEAAPAADAAAPAGDAAAPATDAAAPATDAAAPAGEAAKGAAEGGHEGHGDKPKSE